MKKNNRILLLLSCILFVNITTAQTPFTKGVNLSGWFQTSNVKQIQFTKYTKKDFENIKSLGCDVIRLPINLHFMTNGAPDYKLDPLFLQFLDEVVDWAEELNLNLLLDNHTFDPAVNTDNNVGDILVKVWGQMADHYKNTSKHIFYEVLNEPHGISDALWGNAQKMAIDAIRKHDSIHTIIVGGSGWNSYNNLDKLPVYADTNLLYTFHFYDPFLFTHQGASWNTPSMASLAGVPFPYKADSMPACPNDLKGTWIEGALTNYQNEGSVEYVHNLINVAIQFRDTRKVKIFCGEFGVYIPNSLNYDRVTWYREVRNYFETNGIGWTSWDYLGAFGLFEKGSNEMFDYDLNVPLLKALGLNIPPQTDFVTLPDSQGFAIYNDYIGEKLFESSNPGVGKIDYYSGINPNNEMYCLSWNIGAQYTSIGFDMVPNRDLSALVNDNYAIDFLVRGLVPGLKFDMRFIDSKTTDTTDHPWRMYYTIDETIAKWDGYWHQVHIPLKNFTEQGSWDDNQWFVPLGKFDWTAIDRFEISAEMTNLVGKKFWFDNIYISDMDTAAINDTTKYTEENPVQIIDMNRAAKLKVRLWPNPMKDKITIEYSLRNASNIDISIFSLDGIKQKNLVNKYQLKGVHTVTWNGKNTLGKKLLPGVYICIISTKKERILYKIILNK